MKRIKETIKRWLAVKLRKQLLMYVMPIEPKNEKIIEPIRLEYQYDLRNFEKEYIGEITENCKKELLKEASKHIRVSCIGLGSVLVLELTILSTEK
ncbi:hypothetical protein [Capnocytophaga canimorsus]|uniref:hypothetical protein n=1 Tax=Capnocytophaga canimorsus TaxID=28188 RepID=UPI0037D8DC35